jgi:hypothetical protein
MGQRGLRRNLSIQSSCSGVPALARRRRVRDVTLTSYARLLPSLRPGLHRSLRIPASLTDQPPLPVASLATVLLAHVHSFGRFDEITYLAPHSEGSGIGIELKAEFDGIIHAHSTHENLSHLFDTCW